MIQDVITRATHSPWPQIVLVVLILCFVGVVIWTFRGRRDRFRHEASLPLDDSSPSENSTESDND